MDLIAKWVLIGVLANICGHLISYVKSSNKKEEIKEVCMAILPLFGVVVAILLFTYVTMLFYLKVNKK